MRDVAPVILIDGRAGSGKSSLAQRLETHLLAANTEVSLVHMDDITPGWSGLVEASVAASRLLEQRWHNGVGQWTRYNWHHQRFAETHAVSRSSLLIIEGCGALTRHTRNFADARIWLDCSEEIRQTRALDRDGEIFAPHWDAWAEQETRLIAAEQPHLLADIVFDTSPHGTLDECFQLLSSFLEQAAISEPSSKPATGENSTPESLR